MKILRCKTLVILGLIFIMMFSPIYKPYTVGDVKEQTINHQSYDNLDKMRYKNFAETSKIQNIIINEQKYIEMQATMVAYSGLSRGGTSRDAVRDKIINKITQRDNERNETRNISEKEAIADTIISESLALNINPLTIAAMIDVESRFKNDSTSVFGAKGLMQMMPDTAEYVSLKMDILSYDLNDFKDNIKMGIHYYAVDCVGAWSHNNITQLNPKTGELLSPYEMGLMTYNGNTRTARNLSNIEYMYLVENSLSEF